MPLSEISDRKQLRVQIESLKVIIVVATFELWMYQAQVTSIEPVLSLGLRPCYQFNNKENMVI